MNKKRILTASVRNFTLSHPRLVTIGIHTGIVMAISAAMGLVLYPEQQPAFAKAFVFYPE